MQADWLTFVHAHPPDSTSAAASDARQCRLLDLSSLGLIRAVGAQAGDFLQGQLSNDLLHLDDSNSQLAGYATPQGRLLAILRVLRHGDEYLLLLPDELLQATVARLSRYVLRARVELSSANDHYARIGLLGTDAVACARELAEPDAARVVEIPGPTPRALVIAAHAQAPALWQRARARLAGTSKQAWRAIDIAAGMPAIYAATSDVFVPQMVNLELVGGVDFKKGCYPGQEIVARTHYLGRIKRRMYALTGDATAQAQPGDILLDADGETVGTVVDAVNDASACHLLAVLRPGASEQALRLRTPDGAVLRAATLPYAVPLAASA